MATKKPSVLIAEKVRSVTVLEGNSLTFSPDLGLRPGILGALMTLPLGGSDSDRGGVRVAAVDADGDNKADVAVATGGFQPARARVYLGKNFSGLGEPTSFQDLSVFGGAALADGIFVG